MKRLWLQREVENSRREVERKKSSREQSSAVESESNSYKTKKETPGERLELSTSRLTVERAANCAIQDMCWNVKHFDFHIQCVRFGWQKIHGAAGYRSLCLSHAKRALYHLSYSPSLSSDLCPTFDKVHSLPKRIQKEVVSMGLEPMTNGLLDQRSTN